MSYTKGILKVIASQLGEDRCKKCGVSIQPTPQRKVMDEEGNKFCSWWCKKEWEKESQD